MNAIILRYYEARWQAEIAQGLLEADGIKSVIEGGDENEPWPFTLRRNFMGVKLMVAPMDRRKADGILSRLAGNGK